MLGTVFGYSSLIILLCISVLSTCPGKNVETTPSYAYWNSHTNKALEGLAMFLWFTINVISTFIAIYAIYKLSQSVRELRKNNPNLKFNFTTMTVHTIMLTIQLLGMFIFAIFTLGFSPESKSVILVNIILTGIDCIVQFLIEYICWSQGASEQLKKFRCTFNKDQNGNLVIHFRINQDDGEPEILVADESLNEIRNS